MSVVHPRKQIITLQCQTLKQNILLLDAKSKEKGLVDKSDISNLVKNSDLKAKLATLATKA